MGRVERGELVLGWLDADTAGPTRRVRTVVSQVHDMLLEAARRAVDLSQDPAPYVLQTALSDVYVEYRLWAQSRRSAPRRRAETMSQLHAHMQDVFDENGVQIMSPHSLGDPPAPQVVPPGGWSPGLAPATAPLPQEPGGAP